MTKLFLVRHGESTAQVEDLIGASKSTPLTQKGVREAMIIGRQLANQDIRYFISSRYKRAVDTMHYIGGEINQVNGDIQFGKYNFRDVLTYDEFNERHHGSFADWKSEDVKQLFGEDVFNTWFNSIHTKAPSGETLYETYNRVVPTFVTEVRPLLEHKNVLLVSHCRVMQALRCFLEKKKPELMITYNIPNATIYTYNFD